MSRDLRPIFVRLVPRAWTAEQALDAVELLQQLIAAIWSVHGAAMGKAMVEVRAVDEPEKPVPKRPTR
jgi:hypothetical protein